MDSINLLESEFKCELPTALKDKIEFAVRQQKMVVFSCYNYCDFQLPGHQLLQIQEEKRVIDDMKSLHKRFPVLTNYIPVGFNGLDQDARIMLLPISNNKCGETLYYFHGFEDQIFFFVDTQIPIDEVLNGTVTAEQGENGYEYLKINSCSHDFENVFDRYILANGYGQPLGGTLQDLNELISGAGVLSQEENKILLDGRLIYEYPYQNTDDFIADAFFKVLEKELPGYCWFQAFIHWDLEHWGFGKIKTPSAPYELMRKGYRKFDYE